MEMVHFIPPGSRKLAFLAAQTDSAPALISGGAGTGKGAIARWIHQNGPRAAGPFIETTLERGFAPQLRLAEGGTLMLHEIGEWPLAEQMQILAYLRAPRTSASVRIIATTSQALDGRAQGGLFNSELLEKLNVFRIEMPALTRRSEEFEAIALGLLEEISRDLRKEQVRAISPEAWAALKAYEWPGNLRELRNVLRVALLAAGGERIEAGDLPEFGPHRIDFQATREQFEKFYILDLLKTYDWEVERTCQMTRMDRPTLLAKIRQYDLKPEDPARPA